MWMLRSGGRDWGTRFVYFALARDYACLDLTSGGLKALQGFWTLNRAREGGLDVHKRGGLEILEL